MKLNKLSLFLIGLTAMVLAVACSARKSTPLKGPVQLDDPHLKNGQIQFMAHCQRCHPMGEAGLGLAINPNPAPSFVKRYQVRHGLGVMPAFGDEEISDEDLDDILQYLQALQSNTD